MPDSRQLQILLGTIFLGLGAWTLLFPAYVEQIVLQPQHIIGTAASAVFIACFGAQAMLCGTVTFAALFNCCSSSTTRG